MNIINYKKFRLNKLLTPEFNYLLLLLYWPFYGLCFMTLERFVHLTYHPVACSIDRYIPFCEFFVIPYYFWFAFIAWIMIYSLLFDIPAFKKFSWFIIVTYTITCIVYICYPTMQELRPSSFERNNLFTMIVRALYTFDTNTNVCPSLHVIGSMAVMFTAWHSERYRTALWRAFFVTITILICAATVFLKQHSIIDIFAGLAVSFAAYPFIYLRKPEQAKEPIPPDLKSEKVTEEKV